MPSGLINRLTVAGFNALYYRSQLRSTIRSRVFYEPFFFPLDGIANWNRLYGKRGLLQYQCVIPEPAEESLASMLHQVSRSAEAPSLAVLKRFGSLKSPGMLSFPRPGITLAIDFANRGPSTLALLEQLDELVRDAGGSVYPAKDARMSTTSFRRFFPEWESFALSHGPEVLLFLLAPCHRRPMNRCGSSSSAQPPLSPLRRRGPMPKVAQGYF